MCGGGASALGDGELFWGEALDHVAVHVVTSVGLYAHERREQHLFDDREPKRC